MGNCWPPGSGFRDPHWIRIQIGKPLIFFISIKLENKDLPRVRRLEALWNICGEVSETAKTLTISKISSAYILKLQLHREVRRRMLQRGNCLWTVATVLGSIPFPASSETQWNLRGGRWSSVERSTYRKKSQGIPLLFVSGSCLKRKTSVCERQLFVSGTALYAAAVWEGRLSVS